jgi:hypothetical protein
MNSLNELLAFLYNEEGHPVKAYLYACRTLSQRFSSKLFRNKGSSAAGTAAGAAGDHSKNANGELLEHAQVSVSAQIALQLMHLGQFHRSIDIFAAIEDTIRNVLSRKDISPAVKV